MAVATSRADGSRPARMLIGGEWLAAADGRTFAVEDPAHRGRVVAEVPRAGVADVDRAVRAAADAFPAWSAAHWKDRAAALSRSADAIEAAAEDLARLLSTETGNALRNISRPEVRSVVEVFRYFAGLASETKGETIPLGEHVLSYTRREPYGVVAAIVPWNVPLVLSAVKIAPALAAGNTMVLKPSASAPLAVLELARICQEHLPKGVLNVVTGTGEECGMELAEHPLVRKISFTGSTEVGRAVMRAAAERIVPVSLELGGKSPQVVFADAHQPAVVDGVISAMRFTRQGQSCTAGSRLFLHASIFDAFLADVAAKLGTLRVGDPLDEATDMGAVIDGRQFAKICDYIAEGQRQEGARTVIGGLPPDSGPLAEGYFVEPTVIANVRNDWRIAKEEVFGPVLVAIPWTDEDEVVRMANDSHYGLAAFVWTHDVSKALRTAHRLEAGWVQVNQGLGQSPGQSCTAGSRLFLHASIFDAFLSDVAAKLGKLRVGDPLDEETDMGAVIDGRQFEKICGYIAEGQRQDGARTVTGGLPPESGPLAEGYFIEPTVIANVRNDWRIAKEEVFGPVLVAIPWTDEDEVVRMANDSHYGLAAFVWTHDVSTALRTAHRLEAGWVQVNQGLGQFPGQSYGGYKQSGIGREYSLEGMLEGFTQRKSVTVNLTL